MSFFGVFLSPATTIQYQLPITIIQAKIQLSSQQALSGGGGGGGGGGGHGDVGVGGGGGVGGHQMVVVRV